MFGHCWRFGISQSNLNFWVGYGRNLRPWWTRPPRSCQSLCKTLARFLKTNQFSKSLNFRKTPRKQCDHEDSSTWKHVKTIFHCYSRVRKKKHHMKKSRFCTWLRFSLQEMDWPNQTNFHQNWTWNNRKWRRFLLMSLLVIALNYFPVFLKGFCFFWYPILAFYCRAEMGQSKKCQVQHLTQNPHIDKAEHTKTLGQWEWCGLANEITSIIKT